MSKLKTKVNKGAYIRNANLIGAGQKPNIQIKPQEFDNALWAKNQETRVSKLQQKVNSSPSVSPIEKKQTPPPMSI